MAHVAKYKAQAVGPMVGHYCRRAERDGFERANIDPERTDLNWEVGCGTPDGLARAVRDRIDRAVAEHREASGKAVRKDAVLLCDWVVTLPRDCPEDRAHEFFESVTHFVQARYGAEQVPGAFVHMDEATPHAHIPVVPVAGGKLAASRVVNRADLASFHKDLGAWVDRDLGMHVSIELGEGERGERELSRLGHEEYKAAKAELGVAHQQVEQAQERLECLRQEIRDVEPLAQGIGESAATLFSHRGDGGREEELRGEIEQLRGRVSHLEREAGDLGGRVRRAERRRADLEERVRGLISRLDWVPDGVSHLARAIAERLGRPIMSAIERWEESCRAMVRGRAAMERPHERPRGDLEGRER